MHIPFFVSISKKSGRNNNCFITGKRTKVLEFLICYEIFGLLSSLFVDNCVIIKRIH